MQDRGLGLLRAVRLQSTDVGLSPPSCHRGGGYDSPGGILVAPGYSGFGFAIASVQYEKLGHLE